MEWLSLLSAEAAQTLAGLALQDIPRAHRLLFRLGERAGSPAEGVPLLEAVLQALPDAPDPEMALLNLDRWTSYLPTPATTLSLLIEHPVFLSDLLCLFGTSQYLSDILARDPWLYGLLLESDEPRSAEYYERVVDSALRSLRKPESRRNALRRVKRREFLRIGWRDLTRRAPFEDVVREISDLADALVRGALRQATEEVAPRFATASEVVRFAVIAMGKLGARELNYSSDIDLVFVMESPDPYDDPQRRYATRLAETLIEILSADTAEGRCFRVDMRLRPEGRSGALVRSYAAFRNYYDRWAETWERQALIKARAVAGDPDLGQRFLELVRPVTYRSLQGATLLEDVREMRAAVERKLDSVGEMDIHVKEGRGTIRDVEFTVQLLQLLFGSGRPSLQVSDTVTALRRLQDIGLLSDDEADVFYQGYRFFREVEHRLQLLHDLPVRVLPADSRSLLRLARSMGEPDAEAFREAYRRHSRRVRELSHAIHARLGTETGSGDNFRAAILTANTPESEAMIRERLQQVAFPSGGPELDTAVANFRRLAVGDPKYPHPSATRRLFADLAPAVLTCSSEAADPGWALEGLADFADRKLVHRSLYQTLLEHPDSLQALCHFAGAAPAVMRTVLRFPELSDVITDEEQWGRRKSREDFDAELRERLDTTPPSRQLSVLRRYKLREWVRFAARHVLRPVVMERETEEWSDLADALLEGALRTAVTRLREQGRWPTELEPRFAVLALGRYGGRDLHFSSDLDLLYVYEPGAGRDQQDYEALARVFNDVLQTVTEEGPLFELDLRLRPEGRQGFAVVSLEAAARYYGEGGRAQTWEFQTLTRLRFVTGHPEVARQFADGVLPRVYRDPMPGDWTDEIRAMKRRIEQERVSDALRPRHLKLGPGGLSDIEFLVQYLQLRHGGADPALRENSTLRAVRALRSADLLSASDAGCLVRAHEFLTRLRQSLALLRTNQSSDLLPSGDAGARVSAAVARAFGFGDAGKLESAYRSVTLPVRELFLRVLG